MNDITAVDSPIINSPYADPRYYYRIEKGKPPEKREGRRLASYFFRVPERAARGRKRAKEIELFEESTKGEEYPLAMANLLRGRVQEWEAMHYQGASRITRELLELWQREDRRQRLFFAQLEAAKTVIFLTEGPTHLLQGVQLPLDQPSPQAREQGYKAFLRYALKMATGTGKTTVMGMLAAWTILNKVNYPQDKCFSDTVLILCPNVTIRERLAELNPDLGEISLYRTRELVPYHRMEELRKGQVIILNWHKLERQQMNTVNGEAAKVVKRGVPVTTVKQKTIDGEKMEISETVYYESDQALVKRILGAGRGRSQSIFVFNDEAHHAYRRGDIEGEEVVLDMTLAKQNDREATVWIEGLDRINKLRGGNSNGIRLCIDFSATPFYIQGSGNEVGKPFSWIVSDFSLLEAIESGLVKVPQLPTQDLTGQETPSYFNIWRWVQEQLEKDAVTSELTPELVLKYAATPIRLLATDWEKTFTAWEAHFKAGKRRSPVPPVFIIVCRDTALAKEVYAWLANGKSDYGMAPEAFRNKSGQEVTVRIDSKVAEDIAAGIGKDEERRLRFILETVGKTEWPGGRVPPEYAQLVQKHNQKAAEDDSLAFIDETIQPGRDIRCIISVAMLSEGWDATTVTHVVGLRPFGSQLLCEQVVGRALRRTSYVVDEETGLFREEVAQVFGVPFELIPFKASGKQGQPPTTPSNHVYAVPEKDHYEISFPLVEGYFDPGRTQLDVNWEQVPTLVLDPMEVTDETLTKGLATEDGHLAAYGPGPATRISLVDWRAQVRPQQVAFELAAKLTTEWLAEVGESIPKHRLFSKLLTIALRFLGEKMVCKGNRQVVDVGISPYYQRAVSFILSAISPVDESGESSELPIIPSRGAGERSTAEVDFYTGRDLWPAQKCHLNAVAADTKTWEQSAACALDIHDAVVSWVKNDHLGFTIPYRKAGMPHRYQPDFIVMLASGLKLILEVKGQSRDADIKAKAALRWVNAVNRDGRFGRWVYEIVYHPTEVLKALDNYAAKRAA